MTKALSFLIFIICLFGCSNDPYKYYSYTKFDRPGEIRTIIVTCYTTDRKLCEKYLAQQCPYGYEVAAVTESNMFGKDQSMMISSSCFDGKKELYAH